jgi:hypothetical protein
MMLSWNPSGLALVPSYFQRGFLQPPPCVYAALLSHTGTEAGHRLILVGTGSFSHWSTVNNDTGNNDTGEREGCSFLFPT